MLNSLLTFFGTQRRGMIVASLVLTVMIASSGCGPRETVINSSEISDELAEQIAAEDAAVNEEEQADQYNPKKSKTR